MLVNDTSWLSDLDSQTPYSLEAFKFAKAWAELMESKIGNGVEIKDIAEETKWETAKKFDLTPFLYTLSIKILLKHWKFGNILKEWHNQKYDPGNKKKEGIVNIAVF